MRRGDEAVRTAEWAEGCSLATVQRLVRSYDVCIDTVSTVALDVQLGNGETTERERESECRSSEQEQDSDTNAAEEWTEI